jgi:hypothetical protein
MRIVNTIQLDNIELQSIVGGSSGMHHEPMSLPVNQPGGTFVINGITYTVIAASGEVNLGTYSSY